MLAFSTSTLTVDASVALAVTGMDTTAPLVVGGPMVVVSEPSTRTYPGRTLLVIRLSARLGTLLVSDSVAVPVAAAASWKVATALLRRVVGSGLNVIVPSFPVAAKNWTPAGSVPGLASVAAKLEPIDLVRLAAALSRSTCWTTAVTTCVPPPVAAALSAVTRSAARSDGTRLIVCATTLPPVPLVTAAIGASTDPTLPVKKTAFGTVTARVVANATPPLVDTCVPAGTGTANNVLVLVNVTVPVAAVSTTF